MDMKWLFGYQPGPRFTNGFSIAIQIRWKFRFTLISILIQWSLQNFVHGTTAVLSWHVQKFVAIWWPATELQQGEVSIEFELRAKISLVKRAPVWNKSTIILKVDLNRWLNIVSQFHENARKTPFPFTEEKTFVVASDIWKLLHCRSSNVPFTQGRRRHKYILVGSILVAVESFAQV